MRTLSVDGTRLVLPNHESVRAEFGVHKFGPKADSERSLALVSVCYDVLNLLSIDAEIAPYASSERDLLYKHVEKLKENDLLLLDRGYPSKGLFFLLMAKGIHFCVRMKDNWWNEVNTFVKSGEKEQIVTFNLPKKDHKLLKEYPQWQEKQRSTTVEGGLDCCQPGIKRRRRIKQFAGSRQSVEWRNATYRWFGIAIYAGTALFSATLSSFHHKALAHIRFQPIGRKNAR
jgi:hypothetical protein